MLEPPKQKFSRYFLSEETATVNNNTFIEGQKTRITMHTYKLRIWHWTKTLRNKINWLHKDLAFTSILKHVTVTTVILQKIPISQKCCPFNGIVLEPWILQFLHLKLYKSFWQNIIHPILKPRGERDISDYTVGISPTTDKSRSWNFFFYGFFSFCLSLKYCPVKDFEYLISFEEGLEEDREVEGKNFRRLF